MNNELLSKKEKHLILQTAYSYDDVFHMFFEQCVSLENKEHLSLEHKICIRESKYWQPYENEYIVCQVWYGKDSNNFYVRINLSSSANERFAFTKYSFSLEEAKSNFDKIENWLNSITELPSWKDMNNYWLKEMSLKQYDIESS